MCVGLADHDRRKKTDVVVTDARMWEIFAEADRELQRPGRNLALHPFVVGVNEGKFSLQQLFDWATQTYIYVKLLTPYIAFAFGIWPNSTVRRDIWHNPLEDQSSQLTGSKSHPELQVGFALSVSEHAGCRAYAVYEFSHGD